MFESLKSFFFKSVDSDTGERPFYPATSSEYNVRELNRSDYLRLYKSWVFMCVSTIADTVAGLSYTLENNGKEVKGHKHMDLINPNLLRYITTQMLLTGTSYLWKIEIGKYVDELHRLRSDTMTIDENGDGSLKCYRYTGGRSQITLLPENVMDFSLSNPLETYPYTVKGVSPVAAIAIQAEMDNTASRWNWNFFKNGATLGSILSTDQTISPENKSNIIRKWKENYQGVNNSHAVAILDNGLKYSSLSNTRKEMDFVDGRRFTRDEIMAIFKIPPAVVGLTDNANRASATVALETYFRVCIEPLAKQIAEVITKELFAGVGTFYFTNVIPTDAEQLKNDLGLGAITINEYRRARGYDPLPGYDTLEVPTAPVLSTPEPTKLFTHIQKSLASRIKGTDEYRQARDEYGEEKWKKKITRNDKYEEVFVKKVRAIFKKQEEDVLASLKTTKGVDWEKPSKITWGTMWATLTPVYKTIFQEEGNLALEEVGINTVFNIGNPKMNAHIRDMVGRVAKSANDTTVKEIEDIIKQGNDEGIGADEMGRRIRGKFDEFSKSRAEMIARTETITASNLSEVEAWKDSGVVEEKEWHTAKDERRCPQCSKMHGKIIPLGDNYFKKGDTFEGLKLDYMDIQGPALHPSCRCSLLPVIK